MADVVRLTEILVVELVGIEVALAPLEDGLKDGAAEEVDEDVDGDPVLVGRSEDEVALDDDDED